MALQSSGQISINNIATELGFTPPFSLRSLSNAAGKTPPDNISEFYGYSTTATADYYFVVSNKTSRVGSFYGTNPRQEIDGNAYIIYQKPSSANTGIGSYTLLGSYAGDTASSAFGNQLLYSHGRYLTDIAVYLQPSGNHTYIVSTNTKGNAYYINLVQPYLYT